MDTVNKKHMSVKNCWKSLRKLKSEQKLEVISVSSRCTQTQSYSVVDIIAKLRKQQNEVKCMKNANALLEGELRHLLAEIAVHKKSTDRVSNTVRKLKETKEEIESNNELLDQLFERKKAEEKYCQAEMEEGVKETDKIKEWRSGFSDEQIKEVAYLQETLFQARKLRLMVVNTSENDLSNLEDLFESSESGLPIEIDEGTEFIRKKQCLEKRYYEAKEFVGRLQLENEMLLKNLDKLTLVCKFDLLSHGDNGMQNNNHCACHSLFHSGNHHSRSLVPKLDLTFLDSDTDNSAVSDSSESSDTDSDSEDYSDSDRYEKYPILSPNKKNVFERIVSMFVQ